MDQANARLGRSGLCSCRCAGSRLVGSPELVESDPMAMTITSVVARLVAVDEASTDSMGSARDVVESIGVGVAIVDVSELQPYDIVSALAVV